MLPAPIYKNLPLIYLSVGALCLVVLEAPFSMFPAIMFFALAGTVYFKRAQYRALKTSRRAGRARAHAARERGVETDLTPAEHAFGRKLKPRTERSVVDRRRYTGPVSFPLVDSWNRVIPKDRRRSGNRLKDD